MITEEQKSLCVQLYTENNHSIKEIISKTGIRSEQTIYRILRGAGIAKKKTRKSAKKVTVSLDADALEVIEMIHPKNLSELICKALVDYETGRKLNENKLNVDRMKRYFESLCRVYKGELKNPINKKEDEFKWYIWRQEEDLIKLCQNPDFIKMYHLEDERNWEDFFIKQIREIIEMYVNSSNRDDLRKWYMKYFEL